LKKKHLKKKNKLLIFRFIYFFLLLKEFYLFFYKEKIILEMVDKNKILSYGDTITINSDSMYLTGRSSLEKKVYFTKVLNNRIDI
jgi:hypothetical protein